MAQKTTTTRELIEKGTIIHNGKYNYGKTDCEKRDDKNRVIVTCPIHGDFLITPSDHLTRKRGCPNCAGNKQMTTEEFVTKASAKQPGADDLSQITYINSHSIITPICPIHGKYKIIATNYLSGKRCNLCGNKIIKRKKTMTMTEFILKARQVHGYKDTFEKVDLLNRNEKGEICITCKEHGDYWIRPNVYLRGSRCQECGKIKSANSNRKPFEQFKQEVYDKFGAKINVDNSNYINYYTQITAICKIHGEFPTTPSILLHATYGCPKCAGCAPLSFEEMVKRFRKIHGDKYQYIPQPEGAHGVDYKMTMICPIHGEFLQTPYHHMKGDGCPKCSCNISKNEIKITEYIESIIGKENVVTKDYKILGRQEIDILIPSLKIGFEYDGLYWHSEAHEKNRNYHLNKTELAEAKDYRLIHIFEDEWIEHEDIVRSKIKHLLHCDNKKSIGARKCNIKIIAKQEAQNFLEKYHIQGWASSTIYYGAYFNNKLVGVMSFLREKEGMWNLTRFATSDEYNFPGLANKLLKIFIKDKNPVEIKTFLDRRWGWAKSNVYNQMGFILNKIEKPDYYYIRHSKRIHKFNFRKERLRKLKNFPKDWTELQMATDLGYHRIWNCGLYRYVWKNSQQI